MPLRGPGRNRRVAAIRISAGRDHLALLFLTAGCRPAYTRPRCRWGSEPGRKRPPPELPDQAHCPCCPDFPACCSSRWPPPVVRLGPAPYQKARSCLLGSCGANLRNVCIQQIIEHGATLLEAVGIDVGQMVGGHRHSALAAVSRPARRSKAANSTRTYLCLSL